MYKRGDVGAKRLRTKKQNGTNAPWSHHPQCLRCISWQTLKSSTPAAPASHRPGAPPAGHPNGQFQLVKLRCAECRSSEAWLQRCFFGTSGEISDNWKFHWPLFIATLIFPTEETQVVLMQRSEDMVVTWTWPLANSTNVSTVSFEESHHGKTMDFRGKN